MSSRLLTFIFLVSLLTTPSAQAQDSWSRLWDDVQEGVKDEVIFDQLNVLAGPACDLYGLERNLQVFSLGEEVAQPSGSGVDVDFQNSAFGGKWSPLLSLLDITVLFRNESWREIIWGLDDRRQALFEKLTGLKKNFCLLAFSKPEVEARGNEAAKTWQSLQELRTGYEITVLESQLSILGVQRQNLLFVPPRFTRIDGLKGSTPNFRLLPVDKLFYLLVDSDSVDWEQFLTESKRVGTRLMEDLKIVYDHIPETCPAIVQAGGDLSIFFALNFRYEGGVYRNEEGKTYHSFAEFIEDQGQLMAEQYVDTSCSETSARFQAEQEQTSAEQELELFLENVDQTLDVLYQRRTEAQIALFAFANQIISGVSLTTEEIQKATELSKYQGRIEGAIEFYLLVLERTESSHSQGLSSLTDSVSNFLEAVVGVTKDDQGEQRSRLSLAKRFQARRERSLQRICARIEKMYQESDRNTDALPVLEQVNGRTYCQPTPSCEGVNLANVGFQADGFRKLAECSGFVLDAPPVKRGPPVLPDSGAEDIATLLSEQAYRELLTARQDHFDSLRVRSTTLYKAETETTAELEHFLTEAAADLYSPKPYHPENENGTTSHYGLLKLIYDRLSWVLDQQDVYCAAPKP